jgi:O-antigen ligase
VLVVPLTLAGAALHLGASAGFAAVALVTLVVAALVVAGARPLRPPHFWAGMLAVLLLVSYAFPSFASAPPPGTFTDVLSLLAGLGLLAAAIASPPPPGGLARVIALSGGIAAAVALAGGDHAQGRLEAFGLNPNYLGVLMALPLVAAAGLARRTRQPGWLVPAGVCLAGMVATQSRGAFLAAGVGIAVVLVQGRPPRLQMLVTAVAVVAAVIFPSSLGAAERFATGPRDSAALAADTLVRERTARFAASVATEHPLRGIGYGRFSSYAAASPRLGIYIATHNDYLRLAAEAGAVAPAALLALMYLGARGRRTADLAVLRAVVLTYAVGLFFANQLASLVLSTPFWLSLGCLLAAAPDARAGGRGNHTGDQVSP